MRGTHLARVSGRRPTTGSSVVNALVLVGVGRAGLGPARDGMRAGVGLTRRHGRKNRTVPAPVGPATPRHRVDRNHDDLRTDQVANAVGVAVRWIESAGSFDEHLEFGLERAESLDGAVDLG